MVKTTVRVVNEKNDDVSKDGSEVGEIIVKGPGVIESDDEWLHTGDMGTMNENGDITIVNRKKDLILNEKTSISSIEVEQIIGQHPAIQEVAIIVAPHKTHGDILHAIVVTNDGHLPTKDEIFYYIQENLDEINRPKEIIFMEELPKTASGKIQKIHLKELI
ncbi:class I adenylate-forming enzyme family protein [Virgibacillus flavescens]|uniref:class I adenylate-forming enzyme family protein n=1 Tax=Virgibacillus flavescens TaxID=1611422 RepID=UPI003D32D08C